MGMVRNFALNSLKMSKLLLSFTSILVLVFVVNLLFLEAPNFQLIMTSFRFLLYIVVLTGLPFYFRYQFNGDHKIKLDANKEKRVKGIIIRLGLCFLAVETLIGYRGLTW